MDSVDRSAVTPNKSRLARTFAKVLNIRASTVDKTQKTKSYEKVKHDKPISESHQPMFNLEDEKLRNRAAMDAFVAKLFATISSVKATYAQLQYAQSPYDIEGIQSADRIMVSELKNLSELKQSFLKKHLDDSSPETTRLLAELLEQKNLLKAFEITRKKLESQSKLKDSEIIFLEEKLKDVNRENKRLNWSGPLSPHQNLDSSSLSLNNFISALKHTTKSVRSLVKFLVNEMEYANWDLDAAASSIQPDVVFWDETHKCYAFESYVCRVMFDGFNFPGFSDSQSPPSNGKHQLQGFFFDMFMELKSIKPREYITWKPTSMFAKFCWSKYLKLVHPKMESSLFGNLNQRNLVVAGKFPETVFFASFAEVAKRVWLLHCLAFSFSPEEVLIFQDAKGSRFSEVFMESVNEEVFLSPERSPEVAFTVVPGFKLGKTVIQCQVYLT